VIEYVRERYGRDLFGSCVLMARRLVESGVSYVAIHTEAKPNGHWDTHANNFEATESLMETLDPAFATLVRDLREQGYDARCVDATSDADLGERFDLVFAGDVIEHVDNAVALLRFAKRHLDPGGRLLVATPNPFSRKFYRRFRHEGVAMINLDHVAWITPTMALELGRRAGLALHAYHLVKPIARWKQPLKRLAWRFVPPEYTFADFLFEFRLPQAQVA